MRKSILRFGLLALIISSLFYACRKPHLEHESERLKLKTLSGQLPLTIDIEEMYAALPQTIMYNLSDKVKLYIGQTQWKYGNDYLIVRVPISDPAKPTRSYLYGVKSTANPTGPVRVYMKQILPDATSSAEDFSGKQMWINFQDWNIYGVRYAHNVPVSTMSGIPINPQWETTMLRLGLFHMGTDGKIAVYDDPTHPNPGGVMDQIMSEYPDPGPDGRDSDGKNGDDMVRGQGGRNFFSWLFDGIKNMVEAVGNWLGNLGEGGSASGSGNGYGGDWTGPGNGPGNGYGDNGVPGNGPGGGGGGGGSANPEPPVNVWDVSGTGDDQLWASADGVGGNAPVLVWGNGLNGSVYTIPNPTVTFVKNALALNTAQTTWLTNHLDEADGVMAFLIQYVPGLSQQEKLDQAAEHLRMMMEIPDYLDLVNQYTGNWWDEEMWEDFILEADNEIICESNFSFSPVTSSQLWQESAVTNIYCHMRMIKGFSQIQKTVQIPILYFGMPYYSINGQLIYTKNQAKSISASVFNLSELDARYFFKANPYQTAGQIANHWVSQADIIMRAETNNLGRVSRTGSINPSNPVTQTPYDPCP